MKKWAGIVFVGIGGVSMFGFALALPFYVAYRYGLLSWVAVVVAGTAVGWALVFGGIKLLEDE